MKLNKYTLLLSNSFVLAIGNILIKLISFFLIPLYTSILTTEQYGVAELLSNSMEIILPIVTLGILEALYRFSIEEGENNKIIFTNSAVIVFLGSLSVLGVSFLINILLSYSYIYQFCLIYICSSLYRLVTQFARGLGHIKRYVLYGILNSLILLFSTYVLMVEYELGINGYLLSFSCSYGIVSILGILLSKEYLYFSLSEFNFGVLKKMLTYCLPMIPNMLSWWVNTLSDRYILLIFSSSNIIGLYTVAGKLPSMINLITLTFQQAWQYSTAKEISSRENSTFFSKIFEFYSFFCVIVCAFLLLFNQFLSFTIFKTDFQQAWKFVPLLLFAATLGSYSAYFGAFYNAMMDNKVLMFSTVTGALINTVLNFSLIPFFNAYGAAVATVVSYIIIVEIRLKDISKKLNLDIDKKKLHYHLSILCVYSLVSSTDFSYLKEFGTVVIAIILFLERGNVKIIIKKCYTWTNFKKFLEKK